MGVPRQVMAADVDATNTLSLLQKITPQECQLGFRIVDGDFTPLHSEAQAGRAPFVLRSPRFVYSKVSMDSEPSSPRPQQVELSQPPSQSAPEFITVKTRPESPTLAEMANAWLLRDFQPEPDVGINVLVQPEIEQEPMVSLQPPQEIATDLAASAERLLQPAMSLNWN